MQADKDLARFTAMNFKLHGFPSFIYVKPGTNARNFTQFQSK